MWRLRTKIAIFQSLSRRAVPRRTDQARLEPLCHMLTADHEGDTGGRDDDPLDEWRSVARGEARGDEMTPRTPGTLEGTGCTDSIRRPGCCRLHLLGKIGLDSIPIRVDQESGVIAGAVIGA